MMTDGDINLFNQRLQTTFLLLPNTKHIDNYMTNATSLHLTRSESIPHLPKEKNAIKIVIKYYSLNENPLGEAIVCWPKHVQNGS